MPGGLLPEQPWVYTQTRFLPQLILSSFMGSILAYAVARQKVRYWYGFFPLENRMHSCKVWLSNANMEELMVSSPQKTIVVGILLCGLVWIRPSVAEEIGGTMAPDRTNKKTDIYAGVYVLGSSPKNKNLVVGGDEIPQTTVGSGMGAGIKAGLYPSFTNRVVGIEAEIFGHGGDVTATRTTVSGGTRFANANLITFNTMANLVMRYPGEILQPYIGAGWGLSSGFLTDIDIQRGTDRLTGTGSTTTVAYQFLGGLRANLTKNVFLFGEYRYFAAKYRWDSEGSGPDTKLDFRTQYITGGVGLSF